LIVSDFTLEGRRGRSRRLGEKLKVATYVVGLF
jgi:hypothetical protein